MMQLAPWQKPTLAGTRLLTPVNTAILSQC